MKKTASILFSCMALYGHCQTALVKQWDHRYGHRGNEAGARFCRTMDGGYALIAPTNGGMGSDVSQPSNDTEPLFSDYWVIKVDALGNKQWDRRFGGNSDDGGVCVWQTHDGGYILGGHSASGISGDKSEPSRGSYDYWIIKLDAQGNKEWDRTFGGTYPEFFQTLIQTSDHGYLIAGESQSQAGGDKTQPNWSSSAFLDMWLVKVDSLGNKEWDKRFGGDKDETCHEVIQCGDGGYLLVGGSNSGVSGDKTQANWDVTGHTRDMWLVKINRKGLKQWDRRYGADGHENASCVTISADSNYLIGGVASDDTSDEKLIYGSGAWVIKVDTLGNKYWERLYPEMGVVNSIETMGSNGFLIAGPGVYAAIGDKSETSLDPRQTWVLRVDSNGHKIWDKTVLSLRSNDGEALADGDNCVLVASSTSSGVGGDKSESNWDIFGSTYDMWLVKYCMQAVGIDEMTDKAQIQVYPNPFARDVSISLQKQNLQSAAFTITNATGQIIYHIVEANLADSYTKMLDLGNLPGGTYYITVETDGERITGQVVKQ